MEQDGRGSTGGPSQERLDVSMRHTSGESRLTFRGEIDVATVPILERAVALVMTTRPPVLLIDWRPVTFVALDGVDVLKEAAAEARATGNVLRLVPGDTGRRVLDIVGWDDIEEAQDPFAVPAEVEQALVNLLSMN